MISAESIDASFDSGGLESTDHSSIDDDCGPVTHSPVVDSQLTTRAVPACKVLNINIMCYAES